uniref:TSC22 domain family, member 2 n=1 Tax=Poecilia formosa TaxID=48698 RepID=A0A096MFY1_POEFO
RHLLCCGSIRRATPNGRGSDLTMMSLLLFYHSCASLCSSSSLLGIDGKIEQAMDLVKSHLMLVVREEVELLREQLRELQERNQQLERENHILRTLTHNIYSPTGHRISQ